MKNVEINVSDTFKNRVINSFLNKFMNGHQIHFPGIILPIVKDQIKKKSVENELEYHLWGLTYRITKDILKKAGIIKQPKLWKNEASSNSKIITLYLLLYRNSKYLIYLLLLSLLLMYLSFYSLLMK